MKVRIQKLLADAGVESRRHVEEMVLARRISVNGDLVTALPVMVDPEVDRVTIDGEPIDLPAAQAKDKVYILLHKPKGVYCTNVAQGEQRRAIDLLPPEIDRRVYPVGRLDADSRGLLLMTNDGELTQQLTHPKFGVSKTYTAVVDGYVNPATVERLSSGVWLADPEKGGFKTGRSLIKVIKRGNQNSVLQISIREGRNRQLRRMLANAGHKVRELTRINIGPLELGKLKSGGHRLLHAWEVEKLREAIKPKTRPGHAGDRDEPERGETSRGDANRGGSAKSAGKGPRPTNAPKPERRTAKLPAFDDVDRPPRPAKPAASHGKSTGGGPAKAKRPNRPSKKRREAMALGFDRSAARPAAKRGGGRGPKR